MDKPIFQWFLFESLGKAHKLTGKFKEVLKLYKTVRHILNALFIVYYISIFQNTQEAKLY